MYLTKEQLSAILSVTAVIAAARIDSVSSVIVVLLLEAFTFFLTSTRELPFVGA